MTLAELEETLPNGFHDAVLLSVSVDHKKRIAKLELSIWTGDLHSKDESIREAYRTAELTITGLAFFSVEPPDPEYPYAGDATTIGGFVWGGETVVPAELTALVKSLPEDTFYNNTFVFNWNSFLHIAGKNAELKFAT